jgi:hypothetical protein
MATLADPIFFEQTQTQRTISNFGRKMMNFSESGSHMNVPLEILNAFTRIGSAMADTGSMQSVTENDKLVIKYARKVMN